MGGHKNFVKLHNLLAWVYVQNRRIDELNNADAKTIISENLVIASLGNMPLLTTFRGISSIVVALGNPLRRLNIYIIISNLSNLARSKNSRGSKPERISGNYFDIINYVLHLMKLMNENNNVLLFIAKGKHAWFQTIAYVWLILYSGNNVGNYFKEMIKYEKYNELHK